MISLLITTWQVLRSRVHVNLFRYGIDVHQPLQASHHLRWEDITGISFATIQDSLWGRTLRTRHRLTIFLMEGKPIKLDHRVDKLLELTTRLKANLYPRLLPGLRARFQSGHQLTFGPISMQSNAIMIRDRKIPWDHVSHITVSDGKLIVETHIQGSDHLYSTRIPIIKIPNLELLLQVLQRGLNQQL
jgi:hypothetical protein